MKLSVDRSQRYGKMRAHSATHLLHSELTTIFPQTKQAGSLVDSDYLRFDFYADRLLSIQEIKNIEQSINNIITTACPVSIKEMPIKDAIDRGAKAFFEDKYGEVVRTVCVGLVDERGTIINEQYSFELCGGTHVANTSEIGGFTIVDQQAVASGIKRIIAYTGPRLINKIHEQSDQLKSLADQLQCTVGQLSEKTSKILSEYAHCSSLVESFKHSYLRSQLMGSGEFILDDALVNIKDIQSYIKKISIPYKLIVQLGDSFLIYDPEGGAKETMRQKGWIGGGNETLCQGKK